MDLVSSFVARYRKEYDFYEQSCRMVAQMLDAMLRSAGIRAIVTSRAKNPTRLEAKVRQRAEEAQYQDVNDIYDDIVDLAGVRVALYFPGEREEVGKAIRKLFSLVSEPKEFPQKGKPSSAYTKRFSGYGATHYRVRIPDASLNESQKRYAEAAVEVQVASVLMHAWSEVEHDLVYKPLQGNLSVEEYAILDELNGLVLAGEIALERLQRAGELRASTHGRQFSSHYDLAASLLELGRTELSGMQLNESAIGRVDVLYELLKATDLDTPDRLDNYVKALHRDFEMRPLSEQIIDQILAEDASRYQIFEKIRLSDSPLSSHTSQPYRDLQSEAIGNFMMLWMRYENAVRGLLAERNPGAIAAVLPTAKALQGVGLPQEVLASADRLRRFRNLLVHGIEVPDTETINAEAEELRFLLKALPSEHGNKPSKRSRKATGMRK
ncbi:GTP pyrophosphokinase [Burkholderia gladioli]|uniref:GTP pyrophosphokinase n=1 Tax=Burkholderia gladioli TaxID=28095 RepID=UPI000CFF0F60|nr:RelA/SpoT domain-containing protein [Burkholderia gladioli]MBU9276927.1 RelA/SpoT domain-containing protein [Burkholderia gladioli]PRE26146.1 hypothetical protein C6P72_09900 [Burkholderia gladioli]